MNRFIAGLLFLGLFSTFLFAQPLTMISSSDRERAVRHYMQSVDTSAILQEIYPESYDWSIPNRTSWYGWSDWWSYTFRSLDPIKPYDVYILYANRDTVVFRQGVDSLNPIARYTAPITTNSCGTFWCAVRQDSLLDIAALFRQYPRTTISYYYFNNVVDASHQEYVWRISFVQVNQRTQTFDLYLNEYVGANSVDHWIGRTLPHGSFNRMQTNVNMDSADRKKR